MKDVLAGIITMISIVMLLLAAVYFAYAEGRRDCESKMVIPDGKCEGSNIQCNFCWSLYQSMLNFWYNCEEGVCNVRLVFRECVDRAGAMQSAGDWEWTKDEDL